MVNERDYPEKFIALFRNTLHLNDSELEYLCSFFKKVKLKKNEAYLLQGETARRKAYVCKGCICSVRVDEKGNDHILLFSFEDYWISDLESYYTGKPSKNTVLALEDCELLSVDKQDFSKLETEIPGLKNWYTVKLLKHHLANVHQLENTKLLSCKQRYEQLLVKYPEIFQRVSQRQIAKYLDIAPQSLSRLRARLSKK